jgi:thioredoxin 2
MPPKDASAAADRVHVVCPHCGTTNRVPAPRLAEGPTCGSCKRSLLDGKPFALDAAGFDRQVANSDLPVVVDFWAPWCGPCRMMAPAYEQAAARLSPGVRLAKVDTEAHPDLGARFGIRSIPTLVVFRNGREVARRSGALGLPELVRWIEANVRS